MKKFVYALAFIASTLGAYAQGTVTWANSADKPHGIHLDNGGAVVGGAYTLGLYYSASQNGSYSLISSVNNLNETWISGKATTGVDVAPGGAAWFKILAWDKTAGDFATAVSSGKWASQNSVAFTAVTGGVGSPASAATPILANFIQNNPNGLILSQVPEPTTLAFGALGLGAAILFRRRK